MIEKKKKFKLGDFDYPLPKKHIAQYPGKKRDESKLMVVNREEKTIEHKKFSNIIDHLRKNDLLLLDCNCCCTVLGGGIFSISRCYKNYWWFSF